MTTASCPVRLPRRPRRQPPRSHIHPHVRCSVLIEHRTLETICPVGDDAVELLMGALAEVGLKAVPVNGALCLMLADARLPVRTRRVSLLTERDVSQIRDLRAGTGAGLSVVVGNRITEGARRELCKAGWGWLDLRGRLYLSGPGIFVNADVRMHGRDRRATRRQDPFAGQVGVEVATMLLLDPCHRFGVRNIAQHIGRAASSVSIVVGALRDEGLITPLDKPRCPELFWELAAVWSPPSTPLRTLEAPEDEADELRLSCWSRTGAGAISAYEGKQVRLEGGPLEFYAPDRRAFVAAARALGTCRPGEKPVAILRMPPVPNAWTDHLVPGDWAVAEPLLVALDVAQLSESGAAMLASWVPPDPACRVW